MNAGRRIPADVVALTGITNEMIASAPPAQKVMNEAAKFVGKRSVVAHNASFDRRFWQNELALLEEPAGHTFACTMLIARRIYPNALNHRLSSLAEALRLPTTGRAHRAMADAEMASHLWCQLQRDISRSYGVTLVDYAVMEQIQNTTKANVPSLLRALSQRR